MPTPAPVPPSWTIVVLLGALMVPLAGFAATGDDAVRRYRDYLVSSAYYDPSDAVPMLRYGPQRSDDFRLPARRDAHQGIRGVGFRTCASCHEAQRSNIHSVRGNNTCRQCHGGDPIASVDHYFSPLNPIRRHAYVCAKCHQGASASFATYLVHEPAAGAAETRSAFPALYWSHIFMFLLIVGVFIVMLPHSVLWWVREWFVRKKKGA